jgi:hypothetical protein
MPPLDESHAKAIVAVIDVVSVRFYERNGGFGYMLEGSDGEQDIIYASAPPFRVQARVVSQLYGPPLDRSIQFKTHSHWGKANLTNGNLKMVYLLTDGNVLLEPDDHDTNVGVDSRGRLFVPAYPYPIHFLPCGVDAYKQLISVRTPPNAFAEPLPREPAFPSPPDLLKKIEDEERLYYKIKGNLRYPRYGILVDHISRFLKEEHVAGEEFGCQSR